MNIMLTSLLNEQRSIERLTISNISFRVTSHENRLYVTPETTRDLDLIDDMGGKSAIVEDEVIPFLESKTGIKWQYDKGNPGAGLVFEVDLDAIVVQLGKGT